MVQSGGTRPDIGLGRSLEITLPPFGTGAQSHNDRRCQLGISTRPFSEVVVGRNRCMTDGMG